jgi:hypothetical protein
MVVYEKSARASGALRSEVLIERAMQVYVNVRGRAHDPHADSGERQGP